MGRAARYAVSECVVGAQRDLQSVVVAVSLRSGSGGAGTVMTRELRSSAPFHGWIEQSQDCNMRCMYRYVCAGYNSGPGVRAL